MYHKEKNLKQNPRLLFTLIKHTGEGITEIMQHSADTLHRRLFQ
jgi:hypothetical protein